MQPPEPDLNERGEDSDRTGTIQEEETRVRAKKVSQWLAARGRRCPEEENACRSHWSGFAGSFGDYCPRRHHPHSPSGARRGNPARQRSPPRQPPPRQPPPEQPLPRPAGAAGAGSTPEEQLAAARAAYNGKNYALALKLFEPLANQGNSEAQYWLGSIMYLHGRGSCPRLQQSLLLAPQGGRSGLSGRHR